MTTMKDFFDFIKNVGVPAGVAFFLLIRFEATIAANTAAINELTKVVQLLSK